MENIIDILKAMNEWFFKTFLNDKDFDKFEEIRHMLTIEFEEMDGDIVCVLDILDKIHVSCLKENNLPAIKMNELINKFRKDIYELLNKKYKQNEKPEVIRDMEERLNKYKYILPIFRLNSSE